MRKSLVGWVCLLSMVAEAEPTSDDEAKQTAVAYLKAVSGTGDDKGRELLLGGATMNAQIFALENFEFKKKDPVEREEKSLKSALEEIAALDHAGRSALNTMLDETNKSGEISVQQISQSDAAKILEPTRERSRKLLSDHPVLAYALRVGKEVYWHPHNPMRALLAKPGLGPTYSLELHRWIIVSKEGPRKAVREWPLRVLRFRSGKIDTGWKVIPASDWNAE